MGAWGYGVFTSDSVLDACCDLCAEVGIDLERPGDEKWADIVEKPKLTIEDTRKRLNDGLFKQLYDRYKRNLDMLIIFVLLSMRSGPRITKSQLNYVKNVALPASMFEMPEQQQEIKLACTEYEAGKPYESWTFDFGDAPWEDETSAEYDPNWKARRIAAAEKRIAVAEQEEAAEAAKKNATDAKTDGKEINSKHVEEDDASSDSAGPPGKKAKVEIDPNELAAASRTLIFAVGR